MKFEVGERVRVDFGWSKDYRNLPRTTWKVTILGPGNHDGSRLVKFDDYGPEDEYSSSVVNIGVCFMSEFPALEQLALAADG